MSDLRRALIWGLFTLSLVMLWDGWNKSNGRPSIFSPPPAVGTAGAAKGGAGDQGAQSGAGVAAATAAAAAASAPTVVASEVVHVSTDVVSATLDTRGASLVELDLLRHQEDGPDAAPSDAAKNVRLFSRKTAQVYQADSGLLAALSTDPALPNHQTVMTLQPGPLKLQDGQNELTVVFESPEAGGVRLRKSYVFHRGDYNVQVRHEVINAGSTPLAPQLYLQLVRHGELASKGSMFGAPSAFTGPAVYTDEAKYQKVDFSDIQKGKASHAAKADNGWIAMVQHYFASAWLVADKLPREFRTRTEGSNLYSVSMLLSLPSIAPGTTYVVPAQLYAGPQEEYKLAALAPGLDLVKDYGWLAILAKPLFWLLDKLHGLIGNWGWAIVALVVMLKAAFYGLNASAYRSMGKMKAVNPRITELRERLKDKPQEMQQEMMRIYREEKVNPLGGCLPIVVQMPVFIALYWVLLSAVEMRNAPWIFWVTDLSAKDPFYVLPLVMTASTLLQTWLNPTPPDPVQAKMMWAMPLVFSVMFFFFPAGLVLYWVTNNLLSILQQWLINRQLGIKH
ncbi:MAG: membrane protein insertase YidC [Leptothrix ochracea]|uniref:membrane protein insertase YidC n=1 Tax=Leptothrix ochracea TaxID=735331 RepID=UPI0034E2D250